MKDYHIRQWMWDAYYVYDTPSELARECAIHLRLMEGDQVPEYLMELAKTFYFEE